MISLSLLMNYSARTFTKKFAGDYMKMLHSAATHNDKEIINASIDLGLLTGEESRDMNRTHIDAVKMVAEPFAKDDYFDFGNQDLTKRIYDKMPEIVEKRLKSPPHEVVALHRLLGGTFLMCMRLKARVNAHKLFFGIYERLSPELLSKK